MTKIEASLAAVWDVACEWVWPSRCAACDAFIGRGAGFCGACQVSVLTLEGACGRCAMPGASRDLGPCGHCRAGWRLCGARCGAQYGGALATAIVRYKTGGRLDLVRPLSALLVAGIAEFATRETLLVPVPLHPRRLRRRGFNQAVDLARFARAQLPSSVRPRLAPQALVRLRDSTSPSQGRLNERHARAEGAFGVRDVREIEGREILLLDDVLTTGATLNACAAALLDAGAAKVCGVAIARAV